MKTTIWSDKTNLRAHDLESLLEKTYEAGTKGKQIYYKKEVRGFCDSLLYTKGGRKTKKNKNKTRKKNNQLCDTCSLVKKCEPILNEQVKTLEVQQLKLRI